MPTPHSDPADRLPTTGPDSDALEPYRLVLTGDGAAIIYDVTVEDAWIQSSLTVSLDDWC